MNRRLALTALIAALTFASACVVAGGPRGRTEDVPARTDAVVVGAFNFSESRVLAEVFRQALAAAGYEAEVLGEVGSREIMEPALEQGEVDLVPEYLGTALTFMDPDVALTVTGLQAAHSELQARFATRGVHVLTPSPGENRNEIVVTKETQERYGLRDISDLRGVAGELVVGGPPECPSRPLCLQGLEDVYKLRFQRFAPLDVGGPTTIAALRAGDVDVALLFTTNPAIDLYDFVVLRDDMALQPAENIVPVIRDDVVERHGDRLVRTLDAVTSKLTNGALRRLNARAEIDLLPSEEVANEWLEQQGLL